MFFHLLDVAVVNSHLLFRSVSCTEIQHGIATLELSTPTVSSASQGLALLLGHVVV